jgi:aspartyl-tRNA(Asn)/glutamyl-tRNA(Gln) amidotransferase subunit A
MDPVVGQRMLADRDITAVQYIKALRTARDLRKSLKDTLRDIDVLLMPTTPLPALPVSVVDKDLDTYVAHAKIYARNTRIGNVLDLCGLSIPCGFSGEGLPIGLLICGKPFTEDVVLRAGYAYEQASDWHYQRPSLSWLD